MLAKRFFHVSAALFLLALMYHLGAQSVQAQAGATGFGVAISGTNRVIVMTPNGDVYSRDSGPSIPGSMDSAPPAILLGNFWGGATGTTPTSWGKVKADYRK